MSRVFIVQEPMRRDRATGEFVLVHDVSPAAEYGELVRLLQPGGAPAGPSRELVAQITARMGHGLAAFGPDDYVLPIGAPMLIGWACAIAARRTGGRLRVLQWVDRAQRYVPVEVELWPQQAVRCATA